MKPPPRRFVNLPAARARFGPAIDRLGELFWVGDPLADALVDDFSLLGAGQGFAMLERALATGVGTVPEAPESLRALFAELDHIPAWLDKAALERGGELLFRCGWFGGIALATSLLYGYASPAGNKPLVFSGRLEKDAPRRLLETSRFVQATCEPHGLARHAPGFAITVKVRVMHAHVRKMLLRSGRWQADEWGHPANQHDMAATGLLFSAVAIDTLSQFGFVFEPEETHLFMQLWRYSGYLMGVHPEVLPTSLLEAKRLAEMIAATESAPDEDSRRLSRALFASGEDPLRPTDAEKRKAKRVVKAGQGLIRGVLGENLANQLDVPRHGFRHLFPLVRELATRAEQVVAATPPFARARLRARAIQGGRAYWRMLVSAAKTPLEFGLPEQLLGATRVAAAPQPSRGSTLASVARPR